ncbi:hypothetical protein BJ138DRAFT_1103428 [Hygrophoropsis aurantiaca]|uniref:Uncharacterized protein n=1 Tax=Hygrophoropsis aurantiaca TaxID=72124 RepID=A0ACB8A660_9AGAM|nr:hypothetical protein BJ138DRAFT_1103428 [Hygrophoropsis aurantiaca]
MSIYVDAREFDHVLQDLRFFRNKAMEFGHQNIPPEIMKRAWYNESTHTATPINPINSASWNGPPRWFDRWPPATPQPHASNPRSSNLAGHQRRASVVANRWTPNSGIQADPDRLWGAFPPHPRHHRSRAAMPHHSGSAFRTTAIPPATPTLPRRQPDISTWKFPSGSLTWTPHPQPQPGVSPHLFFSANPILGQVRCPDRVSPPLDPWFAAQVTGGWPLPGTCPQWTAGTFPPLPYPHRSPVTIAPWIIPNPKSSYVPQLRWDIARHPMTGRQIVGKAISLSIDPILGEKATHPPVKKILIVCDIGFMSRFWGPISVERSSDLKVWDVLTAIHDFFQTPLTLAEVQTIEGLSWGNGERLRQAFRKRVYENNSGLSEYQWRQGLRRVDCLGDKKIFWGLWPTFNPDSTWHLNLGLISPPS